MEDFVKNLAAGEGWTDATTVGVLARSLDALVGMGIGRDDIEAIIRREGGVGNSDFDDDEGPEDGDVVRMRSEDVTIVVTEIPDDQPERDQGVWTIVDQYGETHRIERDGVDEPWYAVVDGI